MMIERDLRQTAYNDCKKAQRWEMVLIIALLSGMGLVFGFAMAPVSPYLGCGIGLLFIVLIGCFVRAFRKRHKKELGIISQGILTEAEVVELREEKGDPDDDRLRTMAVCEFSLPGGRKHRIKTPATDTMAGVLGAIRVGAKFPVFVDGNHPDDFYPVKPKVTEQTFQDMDSSAVQDMDSLIMEQYLSKQGKNLDKLGSKELYRAYKESGRVLKAIAAVFIIAVFGGIGFFVYDNWRDTRHDPIDLPFGTFISLIGTAEVYQYFPETNEWSYYGDDFGVRRTKRWRFDSKCREPLEIGYTSLEFGHQDASCRPVLLIPESYRDRMDEFIKDKDDTDKTLP